MTVNADFSYPVLSFWSRPGSVGDDFFGITLDPMSFDKATRSQLGIGNSRRRFIDNDGRSWSVKEIIDLGRITPFWLAALMTLMFQAGDIEHQVEYILESQGPTSFGDVQASIVGLMEGDPDMWVDVHTMDGETVTEATLLAPLKAAIMGAADLKELVARLDRLSSD